MLLVKFSKIYTEQGVRVILIKYQLEHFIAVTTLLDLQRSRVSILLTYFESD